ncbi:hypothetical protein G6F42_028884 [Rhizopus arrhizus]|nr:hypothetical protein G6F42_028884 [Rhizopus arrhizus]
MQASSDILPWNQQQQQQHSVSTLMQPDFHISDPQQTSAYGHSSAYFPQTSHHSEQSRAGLIHGGRHDVLNTNTNGSGGGGGGGDGGGSGSVCRCQQCHPDISGSSCAYTLPLCR